MVNDAIRQLRDHPNEELGHLQKEVEVLNKKMQPLLKRVEEAA
jgi:hypothetical protein